MFTFGSLGQGMVCVGRLRCFQGLHLLHASIVASSLPVVCCWPFAFRTLVAGHPTDGLVCTPMSHKQTVTQTHSQTNREADCWTDKAGHGGIKENIIFYGCCLQHVFISLCTHVEPCGPTRKCKYIPQADLGVSWRRVAERLCREFESIACCACMKHPIIPFIGIVHFTDTFALLDPSLC